MAKLFLQVNTKWFYICGMEKQITIREAWADFYEWGKRQPFWKDLTKQELRRMYDAQADYKGSRGQGLGHDRIKSILTKYAPGRYEFRETVILRS